MASKKEFTTAMTNVASGLSKTPNVLGSHCISFSDRIITYNEEIGISIANPFPIRGCLEAAPLHKIVSNFRTPEFEIKQEDTHVLFISGKSKLKLPLLDVPLLNRYKQHENYELPYKPVGNDFTNAIEDTILKGQDTVPGVYIHGNDVVACNSGIRVSQFEGQLDSFRLKNYQAEILSKFAPVGVAVLPTFVAFSDKEGSLLHLRRQFDEDYPYLNSKSIIDMADSNTVKVGWQINEDFVSTLEMAMSVMDSPIDLVSIEMKDGTILVEGKGHNADFSDEVEVNFTTQMVGYAVKANPYIIVQALKGKRGVVMIAEFGNKKVLIVEDGTGKYCVVIGEV
jgi:hypothetical protein